ncbi:FAD-binding domain-containing protein [Mycena sp. CBHHK59/15]|nr:FAD-binding domain-containing protein [Mycena sp. CBHHK59/15]
MFLPLFLTCTLLSIQVAAASDSILDVTAPTPASLACDTLRLELGSTIVETSGAQYNQTTQNTWSLFNSFERPTCIVYPQSAFQVQIAMTNIFVFGAHYAVQAGAHSAMVGYNSITNGVLISFANMTSVSYSTSTGTITVQPGAHFGDIETAVEPYGVSVLGGRASDIGTGLLLGGGISFVSPLYGWSADSIKAMDVVLGGANRFGIVTRYELYPLQTGNRNNKAWYGGLIVYPGSQSVALSNASAKYIREVTDPKAGLIVLLNVINATDPAANAIYLFYKGASLPTSIFGDFLAIPSTLQSLSALSYYDISNLIAGNGRGNGQQFGASSLVGDETAFLNSYNHLVNFTQSFASELAASYMIISPVPVSQWNATAASGGNAIGNPGVSYAAMNYNLIYPAGVKAASAGVLAGFKLLLSQIPPSPGLPLYVNECDASQNIFATYPNFSALKNTYAKYDPLRFNIGHTAGPIGL